MNKKRLIVGGSALLASLFALSGHAVPITVTASLSNVFVDGSSPATGSFDINSVAAGLGFTPAYTISNATLTFLFADNYDPSTITRSLQGSQFYEVPRTGCGSLNCGVNRYWMDTYVNSYTGAPDWATVTVGGQSASAATTLDYSSYAYQPTLTSQTRSHCEPYFGCSGPYPVWNRNVEAIYAYDGAFSLTMALDPASLLDLGNDGLLNFSISSSLGNFNFLSASLLAELTAGSGPVNPIDPNDPTDPVDVPEPSTTLLLGMGLLMAGIRRQRTLSR